MATSSNSRQFGVSFSGANNTGVTGFTNSTLNGEVVVGNNSFIGSSSVVKQKIKIGKNCFINANIFIDKNLKDNSKIYE